MKMFRHALAVAGLGLAGLAASQLAEHVPGELLIKFVPGQSGPLNAPIGATVKGYNAAIGVSTVKLPATMSVSQGLSYYRSKAGVSYADPNYIARATFVPNDPRFNQQYAPQKIQCIPAWDAMRGSAAIKIAILDTGIDYNHEDLAAKCLPGKDFVNNDDDPMDGNGHGTHCAGNAAALTNNGVGIAGIAPNCSLIPVKVLSDGGSGSYDGIVSGMIWAADNGANVISMSLGGGGPVQAVQDAARYAIGKGVICIAAAGNNGSPAPFYPAYFPEFVAVASTDQNDNRSGFSNYGDWVDVAAPGSNILSTFPGNSYGGSSGTSMACPVVAGLAGLIKSAWPTATPAQVRAQIENNCDPVGNFVIKGRVNAFRSIPTQVTTDPYNLIASAIEMFEGTRSYNTVAYTATSDNRYYAISSKLIDRLGHVATAKVTFTSAVNPTTLSQISFKIEASAANYVTGSFFLWNNQTSKYDYVGAWPLTGGDSVKSFTMASPYGRYFNANRQCIVLVRSIMPISSTRAAVQYALRLDQIQLNARKPR